MNKELLKSCNAAAKTAKCVTCGKREVKITFTIHEKKYPLYARASRDQFVAQLPKATTNKILGKYMPKANFRKEITKQTIYEFETVQKMMAILEAAATKTGKAKPPAKPKAHTKKPAAKKVV